MLQRFPKVYCIAYYAINAYCVIDIILSIDPASRERFPEAKMPTGGKSTIMPDEIIRWRWAMHLKLVSDEL